MQTQYTQTHGGCCPPAWSIRDIDYQAVGTTLGCATGCFMDKILTSCCIGCCIGKAINHLCHNKHTFRNLDKIVCEILDETSNLIQNRDSSENAPVTTQPTYQNHPHAN